MKPLRRLFLLGLLASASLACHAQAWPARPIRLIVPFGVGGGGDTVSRAVATELSKLWGQPFVVDNRPGAHEVVGIEALIKSPGDGYTFMVGTESVVSLNPALYSKLSYNPNDIQPVARMITSPMILATRPDFPASTLGEYIDDARKNPGKYNYGTNGLGSPDHLVTSWFNSLHGLKLQHVPFRSVAQSAPELVAGRLDSLFQSIGSMNAFIQSGRVKVLGIGGNTRNPRLPAVPTFAEAGVPAEFDASFYIAVFAPKGTPPDIVARFARDMGKVVNEPAFKAKSLDPLGFEPIVEAPEQFGEFLRKDSAAAVRKVKIAGVTLD